MTRLWTTPCLATLLGLAPLLVGCTNWDVDETAPELCETGVTKGAIVTRVTFGKQLDDVTAEGINLDDRISDEDDYEGCGKADFVSPDGRTGIDNQMSTLLPLVEDFIGGDNVDVLLEAAIANGQLLVMLALSGVDDPVDDECVSFHVGAGLGSPYLDTNGLYEPYQTFGFDHEDEPPSVLHQARIEDGWLIAGPGPLTVPVAILDVAFTLQLNLGKIRMKITEDPLGGGITADGMMAGGILVEEFTDIIASINVDADLIGAILNVIGGVADLEPDEEGICERVSATIKFETTPAFLFE